MMQKTNLMNLTLKLLNFGYRLRPNLRLSARTSDTHKTLYASLRRITRNIKASHIGGKHGRNA